MFLRQLFNELILPDDAADDHNRNHIIRCNAKYNYGELQDDFSLSCQELRAACDCQVNKTEASFASNL